MTDVDTASSIDTPSEPADDKIKIEWVKFSSSLSQVYSTGLEYCFISEDLKQCCKFVLCKDFLQDALMSQYHNKPVSIYGFSYNPGKNAPIDTNRIRLAIGNSSDPDFGSKIPRMLDFIHQFEKKLKLIRTKAIAIGNPPTKYKKGGAFLLESSNRWILSPPMISLYTLLIRVGFIHEIGVDALETIDKVIKGTTNAYQGSDGHQLSNAKNSILKILKYGYAKIFYKDPKKNYPDVNTYTMHNNMGICAFNTQACKPNIQHWFRDLDKPAKKKKSTTSV